MSEQTEKALQQACFTWFHNTYPAFRGTMWMTHNQATNRKQGAILKGMGMVAGVSDLLWLHRGVLHALELKTDIGKQSSNQMQWCECIEAQGATYDIVRSLDEFKSIVNAYIRIDGFQ